MDVNLTAEEVGLLAELLSNNALAHRVFPNPDTPRAMMLSLSIIRKFKQAALQADDEQEQHDARARKLLEGL